MDTKFTPKQQKALSEGLRRMNAGPTEWVGAEWFRWSSMSSVLESRPVRLVAIWLFILPVVSTMTSEFPDDYTSFPFSGVEGIKIVLQIPFNWYLLYFSAVLFSGARLLYLMFCPEFIKKYGSSASASSDGVTAELVKDYASDYLSAIPNKKIHPLSPEGKRLDVFLSEITGDSDLVNVSWELEQTEYFLQEKLSEAHVRDIPDTGTYLRSFTLKGMADEDKTKLTSILLWKFIDWLNYSRVMPRAFCSISIIVGFVLLFIPVAQGFLSVFSAFWNAL